MQRGDDRKVIRLASGVVWERLTTDSVPGIDFLYVTYEVGGASSPDNEFQRHGGHEWGFVMSGRLGVTICPGRRDRDRNLKADLARLRAEGVDRLLCLSTDAELEWAGVPELGSRAEAFGLNYRWLPVPDQGTCTLSEAVEIVAWCRDGLNRGESVVVTCMGGLGRSGMIAACTLVDAGVSPTAAITSVRAARGPRALETSGQEQLVSTFAAR